MVHLQAVPDHAFVGNSRSLEDELFVFVASGDERLLISIHFTTETYTNIILTEPLTSFPMLKRLSNLRDIASR